MSTRIGIPLISVLLLSGLSFAQRGWERTQYTLWSHGQVNAVLNGSPWTALLLAGRQPLRENPDVSRVYRVFFRLRLLTARPVREALLRKILLRTMVIDVEDLKRGAEAELEALNEVLESMPNDIRVKGDDRYIIFSVTLRVITEQGWEEFSVDESLSNSNISELVAGAFLATGNGMRVAPARYEAPGPDGLGAKLYFPRYLPDGKSLVTPDDRRLNFETCINGRPITVQFDLRKMKYQGRVEF